MGQEVESECREYEPTLVKPRALGRLVTNGQFETLSTREVQVAKQRPEVTSPRMVKLREVAERAAKLNRVVLKERVAIPDPNGGYVMVLRELKS